MSIRFSTRTSYGFGRTVAYQRGALKRVFRFLNKFPSTQALREKIISSNHITNSNSLDEHAFLNIFSHKHQDDRHGIKHMQANHRNHAEQQSTII
jgi:Ca2+-binding EF-hand superfamily protein